MLWSEYKDTFKSFSPAIFSEVHLWEELKWVISQNTTISNSDDPYKLQPKLLILWSVFYLWKERARVIKMKVLKDKSNMKIIHQSIGHLSALAQLSSTE